MSDAKIEFLGGDELPEGLKAAIAQKLGAKLITGLDPASTPSEIGAALAQAINGGEKTSALDKAEALEFFLNPEVRWTPKLGDIVVVRPELSCAFAYPDEGETCVVTQVFDPPIRDCTDATSSITALTMNMALAFKQKHGNHYHYIEHCFDSRYFLLKGNIYDGKTYEEVEPK